MKITDKKKAKRIFAYENSEKGVLEKLQHFKSRYEALVKYYVRTNNRAIGLGLFQTGHAYNAVCEKLKDYESRKKL